MIRAVRGLVSVCALALVFVATAVAGWAGNDPAKNYPVGKLPLRCLSAPTGKTCVNAAVYYLDKARASLGEPAYKLPADFPSLTPVQQLFILTNLDRIEYSLPPVPGLTAALDSDALTRGVQSGTDPSPSDTTGLTGWTGNWASGYYNAPIAYEVWMYDDGLGSENIDCTTTDQSGCWGHRHDILWEFDNSAVLGMGAAAGPGPNQRPGYAMLLVGGSSMYSPTYEYTWAQAVADGAGTNVYNPGKPVTTYCVVPYVTGKTLAAATRSITKAHCAVGTVVQEHTPYAKGTIVFQSPAWGKMLTAGAKIKLTVSLGPQ